MRLYSSFKYHKKGIKFTAKYKLGKTFKEPGSEPTLGGRIFHSIPRIGTFNQQVTLLSLSFYISTKLSLD